MCSKIIIFYCLLINFLSCQSEIKPRNNFNIQKTDDQWKKELTDLQYFILIEEGTRQIKLIDFGFSRKVQMNQNMTQAVGSGYYMAPEVLKNNPYDFKADVWSASIVVFIMLSGDMPFYGKNSEEMINCINKSDLNRTFSMKKW